MNVLILGAGGREHAIAWALRKSPRLTRLYAAPGSPGMAPLAEQTGIDALDLPRIVSFCRERAVGLVVIGPEAPLAAGAADALAAEGVRVFGPTRAAAQLESSKSFAKFFMKRHGIPTARFAVCTGHEEALASLPSFGPRVVVKADGLAAGKGVSVCREPGEAERALREAMLDKTYGAAGATVVLEELLEGREVTLMAVCDGERFALLPSSQDHKRLREGDAGPNTGGMGAIAPAPAATPELIERVRREVFEKVLSGLKADGTVFRGVLYAGLMLTREGPKVLEFNTRFGDPETQAVLPLLEDDLLDLLEAAADGRLGAAPLRQRPGACVCVVLAAQGYPEAPVAGAAVTGPIAPPAEEAELLVFHAGTVREGPLWRVKGGRVLGVTALGPDLDAARERAYAAVDRIRFAGMQFRRDIGASSTECAC
ncbi:MAG: phosphoribosylamine--glycine ligase [Elusimicrobiota bacterium]|jgi:phosphoribosylamine--glycine ligase